MERIEHLHEKNSGDRVIKSASTYIATGKDSMALLRDIALFTLALLLIAFPARFNQLLSEAGFEEGSFVGFKWKGKFLKADDTLVKAQATIADLTAQNEKLSSLLGEVQAKLNDPTLKEEIGALQDRNQQVTVSSSRVEAAVASTIADNAELRQEVQKSNDGNTQWGVVYSGDTNLKDAGYEVGPQVAGKHSIPNAAIYFRQGSYRSVSVVDSRTEAQQVLSKAKERRSDAYIVRMSDWCPSSTQKEGYRECGSQ